MHQINDKNDGTLGHDLHSQALIINGLLLIAKEHDFMASISVDNQGNYLFSGTKSGDDPICRPFKRKLSALLSQIKTIRNEKCKLQTVKPSQGWVLIPANQIDSLFAVYSEIDYAL